MLCKPSVKFSISTFVIVTIAAFYFYLTWHTEYVDFLSDSAIYLLMASYFDGGTAIPAQVFDVVLNDYHLPPTFPIVLWLFGGGAEHPFTSHIINTACVIAAFASYATWLNSQHCNWSTSIGLTCAFAVLPVSLFFANLIVSEYLYITLIFLSLVALEKSSPSNRLILVSAVCIGITITVRSIGISLLPVLLVTSLTHTKRQFWLSLIIAVSIPALWGMYKLQFAASNYVSSFFESHGDELIASVITYAKVNLHVLGLSWVKSFDHYLGTSSYLICAAVAVLVVIGWASRLMLRKPDAIYTIVYLCIIIPWPHPDHMQRFLLPLMPFLLLYGLQGGKLILDKIDKSDRNKFVLPCYLALVAVLVLPTDSRLVSRLFTPLPTELANFSRSHAWLFSVDTDAALKNIQFSHGIYRSIKNTSVIPSSECIWSIDAGRHMLLSKRVSYDTPRPALSKQAFELTSRKCKYFFAMRAVPHPNHSRYTSLYPIERVKQRVKIVQQYKNDRFGTISLLLKTDEEQSSS